MIVWCFSLYTDQRHSRGRASGQSCNPDHTAINKHRARIRNVVKSACYQVSNLGRLGR